MKAVKQILSSALILATLSLTACSNSNVSSAASTASTAVQTSYTENTDISQQEIDEINKLMSSSNIKEEGFSVKSAQQGKDVSVDLLLYNPKATSRAHFWGIKTADKLLSAGTSPTKRWFLTKKLGGLFASDAFKAQVLFWVERADMLRIHNVSLDDSFLLCMAGITSVPHLATFNNPIDQAALKVQLSLMAFQYGMKIPTFDDIKSWTNEATTLPPVLY